MWESRITTYARYKWNTAADPVVEQSSYFATDMSTTHYVQPVRQDFHGAPNITLYSEPLNISPGLPIIQPDVVQKWNVNSFQPDYGQRRVWVDARIPFPDTWPQLTNSKVSVEFQLSLDPNGAHTNLESWDFDVGQWLARAVVEKIGTSGRGGRWYVGFKAAGLALPEIVKGLLVVRYQTYQSETYALWTTNYTVTIQALNIYADLKVVVKSSATFLEPIFEHQPIETSDVEDEDDDSLSSAFSVLGL